MSLVWSVAAVCLWLAGFYRYDSLYEHAVAHEWIKATFFIRRMGRLLGHCHRGQLRDACKAGAVRSTPARMLRQDQLLVERFGVHKITKVDFPLPQNTVTVDMTHQITGARASRNLRWDEQVTTEEAFDVSIGNGKIRVELALLADDEGSPLYRYRITDEAARIDHEGADLRLGGSHKPDNTKAAETLLSFLSAAGEAYETELEGRIDSENLDLFPTPVNEWAYVNAGEIEMAQVELSRGLEAGL
jgi:hypothetical protein